jgi:hypothetical protein
LLCRVEGQVGHTAEIKEYALVNIYKTKEYMFADGAPRHHAGTLHV